MVDRRAYSGNAKPTTLAGGINPTDLTINITDSTGWPSGGPSGKFFVTMNRGGSTEERVLIQSRTGTTLTIADVGDRGVDDTLAAAHGSGETIEHTFSGQDADEANAHIADTTRDDHTQYLDNPRHDVDTRHMFGFALGTPAAAADVGTVAAAGVGDDPAREDHVHQLGAGSIDQSTHFAPNVVDSAAIAASAVGTSELAAASVTPAKLAPDAVEQSHLATGVVGTDELADDAVTTAKILTNAITDDGIADAAVGTAALGLAAVTAAKLATASVTQAKVAVEAPTSYVPSFGGLAGGSNTVVGNYFKFGGLVIGIAQFTIGAGGNVTATINVNIPTLCRPGGTDWFAAARAFGGTARASGMGIIQANTQLAVNFATVGVGVWDGTSPFNWDVGDECLIVFCYASAT